THSTLSSNSTGDGGGAFFAGSAGAGGGLYSEGTATLSASTVSGNTTGAGGSGGSGGGFGGSGGGIVAAGTLTVTEGTISDNSTGSGGDGQVVGEDGNGGGVAGNFALGNSILANNSAAGDGPACDSTLTSQGYNLIEDVSDCTITGDPTGNLIGIDPLLAPLTDNGGPTATHALLSGSPAQDAGSCDAATDQRGLPRPVDLPAAPNADDGCDMGAYEDQGVIIAPTDLDVAEGGATDAYSITLTLQPSAAVTVTITTDGQTTVTPALLTFDPATWNLPQVVTVEAVDDMAVEGTHSSTVSHSATSGDTFYNGLPIADVIATITDNDMPPTSVTLSRLASERADASGFKWALMLLMAGLLGVAWARRWRIR
ncbi:MAG: choice-of-anchor Q domain-containing protein, partial [Ardenticatenaceae bacterium]